MKIRYSILIVVLCASVIIFGFNPVTAQTNSLPPEPVDDLIAVPGNEQISLSWTAPFDNGAPITSYRIIMQQANSEIFTTYANLSTSTSAIITGLKNDVSYSFKVQAINSAGTSSDSNIVFARTSLNAPPTNVPDPISDLVATRDNSKVNLSWSKPHSNGVEITSFEISYWPVGSTNISKKTVGPEATQAQITGLTNGISYVFKINAKNGIGFSPDSNFDSATPSTLTTPSVPNQVRKVTATPSDSQILLAWIEPSDNGSPITSYTVMVSKKGSNIFTTYPNLPDSTQAIITDLVNGQTYQFHVIAVNAYGAGKSSEAVFSVPSDKNSIIVSNLKAIPGNEKVQLSWYLSDSDLERISGYRIRVYEAGSASFVSHSVLGKTTSFTIDGLKNGVPYGFTVITISSDGLGPDSRTVSGTPIIPVLISPNAPGRVTDLKIQPSDSKAILSWTPPTDNGYPITLYRIIQSMANTDSFKIIEYSGTTKSVTISGLQNDATYTFKVQAKNSQGFGPESTAVPVITRSAFPQPIIPEWIKTTAQWWVEGKISNLEYAQSIEWLINQGIIKLL